MIKSYIKINIYSAVARIFFGGEGDLVQENVNIDERKNVQLSPRYGTGYIFVYVSRIVQLTSEFVKLNNIWCE